MTKACLSLLLLLLLLSLQGQGRYITDSDSDSDPDSSSSSSSSNNDLVSDGIGHGHGSQPSLLLLKRSSSSSSSSSLETCEETYGFLPCTTTVLGNLFMVLVYGSFMFMGAKYLSTGSELLLQILGPGVVGGLFLPILGALPDALLILGPEFYPEGDEIAEAPVVGDYGWGQLDQGVEPVIGEPAPDV